MAKAWWTSKTLWVNIISTVAFMVMLIPDVNDALGLSPKTIAILGIVVSTLNFVLRMLTAQPLAASSHQTAVVAAPLSTREVEVTPPRPPTLPDPSLNPRGEPRT